MIFFSLWGSSISLFKLSCSMLSTRAFKLIPIIPRLFVDIFEWLVTADDPKILKSEHLEFLRDYIWSSPHRLLLVFWYLDFYGLTWRELLPFWLTSSWKAISDELFLWDFSCNLCIYSITDKISLFYLLDSWYFYTSSDFYFSNYSIRFLSFLHNFSSSLYFPKRSTSCLLHFYISSDSPSFIFTNNLILANSCSETSPRSLSLYD